MIQCRTARLPDLHTSRYQSGEWDALGGVTEAADVNLRRA